MSHTKRVMPELSSGAMADIAFLLLIFFMVTTEMKDNKGLAIVLPQYHEAPMVTQINDRNIFTIHINSADRIMVEGKVVESLNGVREQIKVFVLNNKKNSTMSDSPAEAVVSIKTDRGTSYKAYLSAIDEAHAAYYEIYGKRVGLTAQAFRTLDLSKPDNKKIYEKARQGIPMNISIAEPTSVSNN